MKKTEKRIDELKEGDIFEFHSMPGVEFEFVKFLWRSDVLEFNPVGTTMIFETDKSCSNTVLVKILTPDELPKKQSSTFGGLGMGTF